MVAGSRNQTKARCLNEMAGFPISVMSAKNPVLAIGKFDFATGQPCVVAMMHVGPVGMGMLQWCMMMCVGMWLAFGIIWHMFMLMVFVMHMPVVDGISAWTKRASLEPSLERNRVIRPSPIPDPRYNKLAKAQGLMSPSSNFATGVEMPMAAAATGQ